MESGKVYTNTQIRIRTLVSFLVFFVFIIACVFSWKWLHNQPKEQGTLKPLRKGLYMNENVFSRIYSYNNLAASYTKKDVVKKVRINGNAGLKSKFDSANWKLKLIRNPGDTIFITLADIKKLPKTEIIFDFKCIEGWSQVTHWGGVRFSDFMKSYGLSAQGALKYTGMETPDRQYYVGIDNESMMHPQTLLCYEMNGMALPKENGYPLRLIIPVKYGVKHLKRIGTIFFSNNRPRDYWFEQGYDYYCGL